MQPPIIKFIKNFVGFILLGLVILVGSKCSTNPPLDPSQNSNRQFTILVGVQSNPEAVAPGGSSIIEAFVINQASEPVAGAVVQFSANLGTLLPATSVTNDSGVATTIFTAPQQTGSADISAVYDSSNSQSVTVEILDTTPQSVTLIPDQSSILANGVSSTRIQSIWRTPDGAPLKGLSVAFATTGGTITPQVFTNSSGLADAILVSPALRQDNLAVVTARSDSFEATTQVVFKGIEFSLSGTPLNLIADGRSISKVRVVLKETTSTIAVSGAVLTFGADLGTIPNSATTNSSGIAEVDLTSATDTGLSTVTALYGQALTETMLVNFTQSLPTYLNVSTNPAVIPADNQSTSAITAVISDQNNNAVSDGTQVSFEIFAGTGTIESNKSTVNGVAVSTLTSSTQPDTVTIVVTVNQLSDTTTVRFIVGAAATIAVSADSSSLPADGITSSRVTAYVYDSSGNPVVDGTLVNFTTNIGEITPTAQTVAGQAAAQFTSSVTGTVSITATVGGVSDVTTIQLLPGVPNSILLIIDPTTLGVKDSGRNQTVTVTADVIDTKNNPVLDGTYVTFSIFSSPGGGEFLSSASPVPTLNGRTQVSLNSGTRSGSVRILAEITDVAAVPINPEVRAVSTEIIIFAGPPFIEDVNDPATSHLSVGVQPLNVYGWNVVNNTATVVAVIGDKFNNPVPPGTAVFFTTTAGVISTYTGFTDEEGVATVTIHTAQPYPTIDRYYNTFFDPNEDHADFVLPTNIVPGPIPDYEASQVLNSEGNFGENDGVARILAVTEGVDANGNSARAWSVADLVFSGSIDVFDVQVSDTDLSPGESAVITFEIYDENGNPIVAGSEISVQANAGALSWSSLTAGDPGITQYSVLLTNNIDPSDPDAQPETTPVTIVVNSTNGNRIQSSTPINLNLN